MHPGQHKALAMGIFADVHLGGIAVPPIDSGRIIADLSVRISISEAGLQSRKQIFQWPGLHMGQRELRIADRCRTGDVNAIAFTGADGDADGVAAFLGIDMATTNRKGSCATDDATTVSAVPPVDGRREFATAGVGATGHCSTESRAFGGVDGGSVQTE